MFYGELDAEWIVVGRNGKSIFPCSGDRWNSCLPVRETGLVFQRLSHDIQCGRDPGLSQVNERINIDLMCLNQDDRGVTLS